MKLDFQVVMEEILKAKSTLTQVKFVEDIYEFIGKHGKNYNVSLEKIAIHASKLKSKHNTIRKKITKGAYDTRVIESMPMHVKNKIIPNLKPEKCEDLADNLLNIIRTDDGIGTIAKERMEKAALNPAELHVFLAEAIIYSLQHAQDKEDNIKAIQQKPQMRENTKIVSHPIFPVSKENYIPRPDIENDIRASLKNRITIVRGMSGLGKSEIVRHVVSTSFVAATVLPLTLPNDGIGTLEGLLGQVKVTGSENNNDPKNKKTALNAASSECIIIVDNFNSDNNKKLLEDLVTQTGEARIVLTSQITKLTLDSIFQNNYHLESVDREIVDIEDVKYVQNQENFAVSVFCRYANLKQTCLTDDQKETITSICASVAYHTMITAALGSRIKEYNENVSNLLTEMLSSVRECLDQDLVVQIPKDDTVKYRTPYEILKILFGKILHRNFTECERHVLGAVIMLPPAYHGRKDLEELVGDLGEAGFGKAHSAVTTLMQSDILASSVVLYPGVQKIINDDAKRGIIHSREYLLENDMAKEDLALHPLYAQLFSDPEIEFWDKYGHKKQGPIAELSADFAFHLLNNHLVSLNITKWYDYLHTYREMAEYMKLPSIFDEASEKNKGWCAFIEREFSEIDHLYIKDAIQHNHTNLGIGTTISLEEIRNIFGYIPDDEEREKWEFENDCFGLIDMSAGEEVEVKLDSFEAPPWEPKHTSLIVVVETSCGKSLWILDLTTNKEFCLLNLTNQLDRSHRYFCEASTQITPNAEEAFATIIDVWGNPQYLRIPSHIRKDIPITHVHWGGLGSIRNNLKIVCFPKTVQEVKRETPWLLESETKETKIVFLGNNMTTIGRGTFSASPWAAETIILPDSPVELGHHCLPDEIDHIVVPYGSETDIVLPEFMLWAYLDMKGTNTLELPYMGKTLRFDTDEIFLALKSAHWEMIEVYDQSNEVILDWRGLFEFLCRQVPFWAPRMQFGVDFTVDTNGNIIFSAEKQEKEPWLENQNICYASAFSKTCRTYVKNTGNKPVPAEYCEYSDSERVYVEDIINVLQFCVVEATMCLSNGNKIDAQTLLQIAKDLLNAKSSILPQSIDSIRNKINELLICLQ